MILRSVTKHVQAQNWFAVGIDFMIVVVGVFIGIQVSNWNEHQRSRQLEIDYLIRLETDLAETLRVNEEQLKWNYAIQQKQDLVIQLLKSGVLPESRRSDFDQGLLYLGFAANPRLFWSTVRELETTGNMTLIGNVDLRGAISRLGQAYQRNFDESMMETERAMRLRALVEPRFGVVAHLFSGDMPDVESSEISFDFDSLADDQELINILTQIQFNTDLVTGSFEIFHNEVESVRAMVETELEGRK